MFAFFPVGSAFILGPLLPRNRRDNCSQGPRQWTERLWDEWNSSKEGGKLITSQPQPWPLPLPRKTPTSRTDFILPFLGENASKTMINKPASNSTQAGHEQLINVPLSLHSHPCKQFPVSALLQGHVMWRVCISVYCHVPGKWGNKKLLPLPTGANWPHLLQ